MAITIIEARDQINELNIIDYSNSKKEGKDKFRRHMHKLAFPYTEDENIVSAEAITRMFGSGGQSFKS